MDSKHLSDEAAPARCVTANEIFQLYCQLVALQKRLGEIEKFAANVRTPFETPCEALATAVHDKASPFPRALYSRQTKQHVAGAHAAIPRARYAVVLAEVSGPTRTAVWNRMATGW